MAIDVRLNQYFACLFCLSIPGGYMKEGTRVPKLYNTTAPAFLLIFPRCGDLEIVKRRR